MQFEIYLMVLAKDERPEVNMLLYCVGLEVIEECSHFVFNKCYVEV